MKIKYKEAGVPTARQSMVTDLAAAKEFVAQVGYPVIVKPNIGVGANDTYKLRSDDELETFFYKLPEIPYVMEEFVVGDLVSYEAILDSNCEPLFENHTEWPIPVMDVVNKDLDLKYYVCSDVPEKLAEAGRKTVKAFGVKNRYVHLEFFRLTKDKEGLGKKGDYVGLEVNMRPAGGYTPDMINFAHSIDTYQIWADMITTDKRMVPAAEKEKFCVYAGRRNHYSYVHSHDDIMCKYGDVIMMQEDMPEVNWPQMGNYMYTAVLPDLEAVQTFLKYVQERSNWDGQH